MYYYKIYGLNIQSDYQFEEAKPVKASACQPVDITITKGELPVALTKETDLDFKAGVSYVRHFEPHRGWIRVKGQGCFVMEQGEKITYQLKEECDPGKINQMFLGFVMSIIMIQRGMVALHGSGIIVEGKTVVISGVSGAGKSTLAAEFLNRKGIFLADDTVAIKLHKDRVYAQPGYPQQKICADTITKTDRQRGELVLLPSLGKKEKEKFGLRLREGYCTEERELSAIFILQPGEVEQVEMQEITGSEKIKYLIDNIYKRRIYLEVGMPREVFNQCVQVANKVKIYTLTRPIEGMSTEIQIERIMEVLHEENSKENKKLSYQLGIY